MEKEHRRRFPWPATKTQVFFQDHPHPPKVNILEKAYLSAPLTLHREVYHLSLTTLHLT